MIKPLAGKIYAEILPDRKETESGLVIAKKKEIPHRGKVLAAGGSYADKKGKVWKMPCKSGDIIHFKRVWDKFFTLNGKRCVFVPYDMILGVER